MRAKRFGRVLWFSVITAGFLLTLPGWNVPLLWGQEDATLPQKVEDKVNAPVAAPGAPDEAAAPEAPAGEVPESEGGIGASFSGATEGTEPAGLGLRVGEVPDEYVIQKGDTLWDISARFFEKPEYWPKLWSYNPYITNPHLIYPNNKLVFKPGTETQPPSVEVAVPGGAPAEPQAIAEAPAGTQQEGVPAEEAPPSPEGAAEKEIALSAETAAQTGAGPVIEGPTVTLREDGYISKTSEQSLGYVSGSFVGVYDLAQIQEVYLKLKNKDQVQIGDLYTIFREEKKVRGFGYLNKILGIVEVVNLKDNAVTARIKRSYYPIARGDLVREYYNALHQVRLIEASNPVDGKIIERLNYENIDIGQGDVVYIDRGNRDGVEPGYEFLVLRQGDGLRMLDQKGRQDSSFPNEVVGRLVVVVARGNNSTAVVVKSKDALKVGDRIATPRKE